MAAPSITSPEQWQERAMALCDQAHMKYTSRYDGERNGIETYSVPSRDRASEHTVTYDSRTDRVRCDCVAGQHGRPCCHSGAVLYYLAQRAQAMTPEACAANERYQRMWEGIEALPVGLRCDVCGEESLTCRNLAPTNDLGDFYACADCRQALRDEWNVCA